MSELSPSVRLHRRNPKSLVLIASHENEPDLGHRAPRDRGEAILVWATFVGPFNPCTCIRDGLLVGLAGTWGR